MSKIIVTGATGHFGTATIKGLLKNGVEAKDITAFVRDENKANELKRLGVNIAIGDYDNIKSLHAAFEGQDKLMFISATEVSKRVVQHENVIKALSNSSIKHVVYTSFERNNETTSSPLWMVAEAHLNTERLLKEIGISYTILRNNLYMDFIPEFIGGNVVESGTIYLPAENGKVSAALRSEMAEAAANILVSTGHENKEYVIANTQSESYSDVANYISEVTGKPISYVSPSVDEYSETLSNAGVPDEYVGLLTGFAVAQAQGELENESSDLEGLLGRKPTSLKSFIETVYSSSN